MLSSKQRSYLMSLSNDLDPVLQIGKNGVSPEVVNSAQECFNTHELIKGTVLKNAPLEVKEAAQVTAERTHSQVVRVVGRKFILYKPFKEDPQILLPR